MPITIGTTFWKCPECEHSLQIDGSELSQIGVPFCDECETEMERQDDPVPTVLLIKGEFVGVVLRPQKVGYRQFEATIVTLWKSWDSSGTEKPFAEWAEERYGIFFLAGDHIINPVVT